MEGPMNQRDRKSPRRWWSWLVASFVVSVVVSAGCPSRNLPPPPEDEPKHDTTPACGKVFNDPKIHGGRAAASIRRPGSEEQRHRGGLRAAGRGIRRADARRDRLPAALSKAGRRPGGDVRDGQPSHHPGGRAGARPRPIRCWSGPGRRSPCAMRSGTRRWRPVASRGMLDRQTILWAGRGRRIVGLHVSKQLCDETQAEALLQKAIDAVP